MVIGMRIYLKPSKRMGLPWEPREFKNWAALSVKVKEGIQMAISLGGKMMIGQMALPWH